MCPARGSGPHPTPHPLSSEIIALRLLGRACLEVQRSPWLLVTHITVLSLLGSCGLQEGAHVLLGNSQWEGSRIHDGLAALGAQTGGLVTNSKPEGHQYKESQASLLQPGAMSTPIPTTQHLQLPAFSRKPGHPTTRPLMERSCAFVIVGATTSVLVW